MQESAKQFSAKPHSNRGLRTSHNGSGHIRKRYNRMWDNIGVKIEYNRTLYNGISYYQNMESDITETGITESSIL